MYRAQDHELCMGLRTSSRYISVFSLPNLRADSAPVLSSEPPVLGGGGSFSDPASPPLPFCLLSGSLQPSRPVRSPLCSSSHSHASRAHLFGGSLGPWTPEGRRGCWLWRSCVDFLPSPRSQLGVWHHQGPFPRVGVGETPVLPSQLLGLNLDPGILGCEHSQLVEGGGSGDWSGRDGVK